MDKRTLERYRKQLQQLAARLQDDTSAVTEQTLDAVGGKEAGELTNAPMHLGDMGTEEYLHDLNATLLVNEEYLLNEVTAALRRIADGTFGRCEVCGRSIRKERLDALPYTRFCIRHADAAQDAPEVNLNEGRPRNPKDTLAPEGEMDENNRPRRRDPVDEYEPQRDPTRHRGDMHAVGTPGGGTSVGGLLGSNVGHGDPPVADLDDAMGDGEFDGIEADEDIFKKMNPEEPPPNSEPL